MTNLITSILVLSFLVSASCAPTTSDTGQDEQQRERAVDATETTESEPRQAFYEFSSPSASEELATGVLTAIEIGSRNFTLRGDDGSEQAFQYSDSTTIRGAMGTQGLAAREGSQARVYYDPITNPPTALNIEISPF